MPPEATGVFVHRPYRREQKIGLLLLLVLAVFTVGLGVLQIRNTMYAPFALSNAVPPAVKTEVASVDALRFRDTDNDTVPDFDELYGYRTSPYLADTDSDGLNDGAEIAAGTNALCPEGKTCTGLFAVAEQVPGAVTTTASPLGTLEEVAGPPPPNLLEVLQDPVQLRQFLREAGMEEEALRRISDRDLLLVAQEVISTSSINANINSLNALIAPTKR